MGNLCGNKQGGVRNQPSTEQTGPSDGPPLPKIQVDPYNIEEDYDLTDLEDLKSVIEITDKTQNYDEMRRYLFKFINIKNE